MYTFLGIILIINSKKQKNIRIWNKDNSVEVVGITKVASITSKAVTTAEEVEEVSKL
jgi:hypothetical protein